MEQRTPVMSLPGAPDSVLAESARERAWAEFVVVNLRVGGSWNEQAVGTNGIGTALAEGRTVQVIGAEHYVSAWQRWVCTGAPIRHPITGETIAVIDVTGYKEKVQAHTLLA